MPSTSRLVHTAARARWRDKQARLGRCLQCPLPLDPASARYCSEHRAAYNRYRRSWRASWKPRGGA